MDTTSGKIHVILPLAFSAHLYHPHQRDLILLSVHFPIVAAKTLLDNDPLIKKLKPHATEIFHIKPAEPNRPQYIGSDLHYSCGFEVDSFDWGDCHVGISLKNDYKKRGSIFLYIPERDGLDRATVTVNGKPGRVEIVARPLMGENCGGRVVRVYVGIGPNEDGVVSIIW